MKDNAPFLEMPEGLHNINYPQKFIRAHGANKPGPNNAKAMHCDESKIMSETMHAK